MEERSWFKHRIIAIYTILSMIIFEKVYETSTEVIDELFHIEQGLFYCHGMFQEVRKEINIKIYINHYPFSGIQKLQHFQVSIY